MPTIGVALIVDVLMLSYVFKLKASTPFIGRPSNKKIIRIIVERKYL